MGVYVTLAPPEEYGETIWAAAVRTVAIITAATRFTYLLTYSLI